MSDHNPIVFHYRMGKKLQKDCAKNRGHDHQDDGKGQIPFWLTMTRILSGL